MSIRIGDYPDQQGGSLDVQRLRADVAQALSVAEADVQVAFSGDRLVAIAKGGVPVPISFVDAQDEARLKAALPKGPLKPLTVKAWTPPAKLPPPKPLLPPGHPVVTGMSDLIRKGLLRMAQRQMSGQPPEQVVPISAELVNAHGISVIGSAAGEVGLQNGVQLQYKGVGLAVKQQLPYGVTASQKVEHDQTDGHLKVGADVAVGGTHMGLSQRLHLGERAVTGSSVSLGQSVAVTESVACQIGVKQSFDENWKPVQPGLNAGVGVKLDKTVSLSWNNQVSAASFQAAPQFSSTVNLQFNL